MTLKNIATCFALALLCCSMLYAQPSLNTGFGANAGGASIPPTGSGGGPCGPTNTTIVTAISNLPGTVTTDLSIGTGLGISIDLQHTYVNDLLITLSHCGVDVVLAGDTSLSSGAGTAFVSSDLMGTYTFRDDAATAFSDANATAGVVDPGSYVPDNSLDAFRGLPAGGAWTVSICDRASSDVGIVNFIGSFVHRQGTRILQNGLGLSIPPVGSGSSAACANPDNVITRNFIVTESGRVAELGLSLNLSHTYAGDLDITLKHNGVEATVFEGDQVGLFGQGLSGGYWFREGLLPRSGSTVTAGVVDGGFVGFQDSMAPFHGMDMSGLWTVTICDDAIGDTGTLNSAELFVARAGLTTTIVQTGPQSAADMTILGGSRPGNRYFKPITITEGNFPNGWFYGVDINMADLATWFSAYPIFPSVWGTFDNCVQDNYVWGPGLPSGLDLFYVALEFNTGPVIQRSAAETYTLQ